MSRRGLIGVLVSELNRQAKAQVRERAEAERAARRNLHEAAILVGLTSCSELSTPLSLSSAVCGCLSTS